MDVKLRNGVSSTTTEYGSVLLDARNGECFQLNSAGTAVLQHLLDGRPPPEVAASLAEEYEVDPRQAEQDVIDLIEQLTTARLVKVTL